MKKSEQTLQARQSSRKVLTREEQENEILKRILLWFGAAVILEAFVLLVNRFYFHYRVNEIMFATKLYDIFRVAQFVGLALCIVCIIWTISMRKKNPDCSVLPFILTALFIGLTLSCTLVVYTGNAGMQILQVAVPALTVLMLVYYLYQHEFFGISLLSSIGILGLWILRSAGLDHKPVFYLYLVFALLCIFGALFLTLRLKRTDGTLQYKGHTVPLLPEDSSYTPVLITLALVTVALLLSAVLGSTVAYYAILTLVTWLFMMAVYFTAKLM